MLLYVGQPFVTNLAAEWSLRELNQSFDCKPVDATKESEFAPVKKNTPFFTVPVLVEAGNWICEPLPIVQFVVDTKKLNTSFFPKDALARSRVLQWALSAEALLGTLMRLHQTIAQRKTTGEDASSLIAKVKTEVDKASLVLERTLLKNDFLADEHSFSFADVYYTAIFLSLAPTGGVSFPSPRVAEWFSKCGQREALEKCIKSK